MKIHGPILAATALGKASDEAIRQANALAARMHKPLAAVHVLPEIVGRRPLFPQLLNLDRQQALRSEEIARAAMRDQWTRMVGTPPPPESLHVESGTPHSGVLQCAEDIGAGLIVVGSGSRAAGTSLGGVAERIVRHAHCPVLVACPQAGGPVIAATDFSDAALPAVRWGAAEASRRGVKFVLLHSIDLFVPPLDSPEGSISQMTVTLIEARREEALARMAPIEAEFKPSGGVLLTEGPADDAILGAAERLGAELVVVGTHGRTGLRRLALGSVAEGVVRRAHCSVMVVRLGE
jgi:nucleotide-binding universal stress UspA family protein